MSDITHLLEAARAGDRRAAAELLPLVYDELRRLAAARMAGESPDHTLNPTALVHEAYLRLIGRDGYESRGHFLRAASQAMRRILIDHARGRAALKRGGQAERVPLDESARWTESPEQLLDLDEALSRFALEEAKKAELVTLRFFGGMSMVEAAETLGISVPTAERWWTFSRAWLLSELEAKNPKDR